MPQGWQAGPGSAEGLVPLSPSHAGLLADSPRARATGGPPGSPTSTPVVHVPPLLPPPCPSPPPPGLRATLTPRCSRAARRGRPRCGSCASAPSPPAACTLRVRLGPRKMPFHGELGGRQRPCRPRPACP